MNQKKRLNSDFIKKELTSLENGFNQFKTIYNYFQNGNKELEESLHLSSKEEPKDGKYIFIRLYDPVYTDNLPSELLKKGQYITNVTSIPTAHAAIGFDLKDNFYGLTIGGSYDFKIEQCTDIQSCYYMQTCDSKKSFFYTYAIKVTKEEYEAAKAKTLEYFDSKKLKYDVLHNVPVAFYCIRRKFRPNLPKIPSLTEYSQFLRNLKKTLRAVKQQKEKDRFVCSTFCCYILISTVPRIALYFCEKNINYDYITPSEISMLPGMKFLFSGCWDDFLKNASEYAEEHPEFKEYL